MEAFVIQNANIEIIPPHEKSAKVATTRLTWNTPLDDVHDIETCLAPGGQGTQRSGRQPNLHNRKNTVPAQGSNFNSTKQQSSNPPSTAHSLFGITTEVLNLRNRKYSEYLVPTRRRQVPTQDPSSRLPIDSHIHPNLVPYNSVSPSVKPVRKCQTPTRVRYADTSLQPSVMIHPATRSHETLSPQYIGGIAAVPDISVQKRTVSWSGLDLGATRDSELESLVPLKTSSTTAFGALHIPAKEDIVPDNRVSPLRKDAANMDRGGRSTVSRWKSFGPWAHRGHRSIERKSKSYALADNAEDDHLVHFANPTSLKSLPNTAKQSNSGSSRVSSLVRNVSIGSSFNQIRNSLIRQRKRERVHKDKLSLSKRRRVSENRIMLSDSCAFMALAGLLATIFVAEITDSEIIDKNGVLSLFLRTLVILSTICLIALVYFYHACEVQLVMIDSGTDDWKVAITWQRIIQIIEETVICSICPVPTSYVITWPYLSQTGVTSQNSVTAYSTIPLDVLLTVPMFLRFYLVGRVMVLHSNSFRDAATRSIASLNRVNVDFKFVIKTLMTEKPHKVLVTFTVIFWLSMSWLFTQCERYALPITFPANPITSSSNLTYNLNDTSGASDSQARGASFLNSLWLTVITFLSIGYGDIVPHTYCGRTLSICTGIVGIGMASALVAVTTRMLDLTKAEKHVNAFMADTKLTARRNHSAANVLQETWYIYKYRLRVPDDFKLRIHQRRFLSAIHEFRRVKWEQRKLCDQNERLLDFNRIQVDLQAKICELQKGQTLLLNSVQHLAVKLEELKESQDADTYGPFGSSSGFNSSNQHLDPTSAFFTTNK